MKTFLNFLFLFFLCSNNLIAQDAYHQAVSDYLSTTYSADGGTWLIANTEISNNSAAISYGATNTVESITGQEFSTKVNINVAAAGNNPWDAGRFNKSLTAVDVDDVVLVTFYARSVNGDGSINAFAEDEDDFFKEYYFEVDLTEEWQRKFIVFKSIRNYPQSTLNLGFHLGVQAQQIEIGGFTAINFNGTIDLDDLPNDFAGNEYGGNEPDAPWRAEAQANIQNLRKATLTINAVDANNNPLTEGSVNVSMKQHDFVFGTAVKGCAFAGNSCQNFTYESKLTNLDGKGHGFNAVVFENDLKWDAWEEGWAASPAELTKCVDFLTEKNIAARGHTLVWPGDQFLPDDVGASTDINFVKSRINDHMEEILTYPGFIGRIPEWDVLNEIVVNRDLENLFITDAAYETGRELYVEIFEKAKEISPDTRLYLNDYVTLTLGNEAGATQYERLKDFLGEIVDAGAPIDGIGFQGHIGSAPNSIYDVLDTYDDFYDAYGLTAKITEFDLPESVEEELAAKYLGDFLTATFSHPSMDGFLFWSFWDGATYMNPGANLFNQDWSQTLVGDKFVDLVFNKWWTKEIAKIDNGSALVEAFKGVYEISYKCNGELVSYEIEILEDKTINIECDAIGVNTLNISRLDFDLFPNPSKGVINFNWDTTVSNNPAIAWQVYSAAGQLIQSHKETSSLNGQIDLSDSPKGIYLIKIVFESGEEVVKRMVIQ